jgi:uncharacterized protein (TIGR04255 family)
MENKFMSITKLSYPKSPIIEAVIDISLSSESEGFSDKMDSLKLKLKNEYPTQTDIDMISAQIDHQIEEGTKFSATNEKLGVKFSSIDGRYILQAKKNGFTFSVINFYNGWESFHLEAEKLWKIYYDKIHPQKIIRVATRFINRIDIPSTNFKLEEYFNTYPTVLKDKEGIVSGFFLQVQIPQEEGGFAVITQTITTPSKPGITSILFDIDIFEAKQFESLEMAWKKLEILREQKNKLFEDSLTQKTKELFL